MILKNSWNKDEERARGLKPSKMEILFRKQVNKLKKEKPKMNKKTSDN